LFSSRVPDLGYRIAPIFLIRIAGVPFDVLERMATVETARAARNLLDRTSQFSQTKAKLGRLLAARRHELSQKQIRAWRKVIRSGTLPDGIELFEFRPETAEQVAAAQRVLTESLAGELASARRNVLRAARRYLPSYLVFAAPGVRERLVEQLTSEPRSLAPRNNEMRANERHLILYLQRVAAKNDSLSQFGPHSWGRIGAIANGLELAAREGVVPENFIERWATHGLAAAINRDEQALRHLPVRLNPEGELKDHNFVFTVTGEHVPMDSGTSEILQRCSKPLSAESSQVPVDLLSLLAKKKLIRWEMEVPALDPHAFDVILRDVSNWREGPVRARWLEQLEALATLARDFAQNVDPRSRLAIMTEANDRLEKLGVHKEASRFLYTATNPIGEECFRESRFVISERLINEVARDAAPWIDLWRDSYAFIAARVAAGLRALLEQAPLLIGALPLPHFLRRCAEAELPLSGAGMVALSHLAFREVKEAFRQQLRDRADLQECKLSIEDCHFVRRDFKYPKFDECTYPSADLQLAAASTEAVARGDYQWVLAELHPPVALLHHGFYWSCPEKDVLNRAIAQTLCGKPYLYYGYFAADFTATTAVRLDALSEHVKFVAPERSVGPWETFRTAETEVFIDEAGDVGVRTRDSKRYLGSFARGWIIPLGFHPFSFSLGRHTPRLLCGDVVVQRESWTLTLEELGPGNFTGVSRDLVIAVEKLRAARGLPRFVYIRPTEQALRRAGVEGRDKDTKPVFIDLESYLFLEILHRWLVKAGEIEATEMLPRPDQLLWQEADGRHTFELRTQIVPA
jgi:hypothetical protein